MRDNIAQVGASHVKEVRNVHRDLLEKAMHMRCISYLSDAKARLLIRTVSTLGQAKRLVMDANTLLAQSLAQARAEMEARREAERRLREITDVVDRAPLLLAICRDGLIAYANQAFAEAFTNDAAVVGLPAGALLASVGAGADLVDAVAARREGVSEHRLTPRRREAITGRVRLAPLGGATELAIFIEDVTKEREVEERLLRAQRVETLGRLTGGIAHDFNNLLMVISANAEQLRGDDPDEQSPARAILDAAARGASLTSQLLASSRRQVLKPEPVDVGELLLRLQSMLGRTLGERFQVRVEVARDRCVARCDPGLLESAIVNLVLNARDASGASGEITLTVEPHHLTAETTVGPGSIAPGEYVRIGVTDRGAGIPPQLAERVWEPFFTTKPAGQNSGLGLSMVLGFAQQSQGGVDFSTAEGRGTTFHLYLPGERVPQSASTRASAGLGRVLLVDDDPAVQRGVCRLVQRLGFEVIAVAGIEDALAEIDSGKRFDLLLTDLVLRGDESGVALAAEARRRVPALPVILMSGYSSEVLGGLPALPPGPTDFLAKPFFRESLEEAIDRVFEQKRSAARP